MLGRIPSLDEICNLFIRPPRNTYRLSDLGPKDRMIGGTRVRREDFTLLNKTGLQLMCSLFEPLFPGEYLNTPPTTCVICCHGNAGGRINAMETVKLLLPLGIAVCAFDFSGCGMSEGNYITLGVKEKGDLDTVYDHIKDRYQAIGIWGKSMGAATTLFFAAGRPELSFLVLDSPFDSVNNLVTEYIQRKTSISDFLIKAAMYLFCEEIELRTHGVDITKINPIEAAPKCTVPAFFGVGRHDVLTTPKAVLSIFEEYRGGPKFFTLFDGDHNSDRKADFHKPVLEFIKERLGDLLNQSPKSARRSKTIGSRSTALKLDFVDYFGSKILDRSISQTATPIKATSVTGMKGSFNFNFQQIEMTKSRNYGSKFSSPSSEEQSSPEPLETLPEVLSPDKTLLAPPKLHFLAGTPRQKKRIWD